ncbi:MAG: OB-fold nucleic acid binding domain-containing protein [Nocardioides sp.]|nr:OB-fold nucleic acid binding domain-containing protein [Nocardioides sp.]
MAEGKARGRFRRTLSNWANSADQNERDLRETYASPGQMTIENAPDRERVRISGRLRTVTLRPRGGVPALEAELDDGTGVITVIWLGRRRITGISPGRSLTVEGRINVQNQIRVIYNPKYELEF